MGRTLTYAAGILSLAASAILARGRLPDTSAPQDTDRPIRRIVSLSPSTTEICATLGMTDRLVARSRFCDWPPEVRHLPSLGGLVDLDFERLLGVRPDLVLVSGRSQQQRDVVAALGLRAMSLPDNSLEDIFASMAALGRATDREPVAREKVAAIQSELSALARPVNSATALRVLLVFSPSRIPPVDPWVALPGSHPDALLTMAGNVNAMPDSGRPWAAVSMEAVLRANPDVILEFWPEAGDESIARRAWEMVGPMNAVRNNRVRVIVGPQHYVPGPRVAETLRVMINTLDGDNAASQGAGEARPQ